MRNTTIHICSFDSGLDELTRKQQGDLRTVLSVLAANKRFSTFDATANQTIAGTMDRLQGTYFRVIGGAYPWLEIELTEKGRALLAEGEK